MDEKKLLLNIILIAGFLVTNVCSATSYDVYYRACVENQIDMENVTEAFPIPIGCEVVDCCPDCPKDGQLDWRVTFDERLFERVNLDFGQLQGESLRRIKVEGGRILKSNIELDRNGALIKGIQVDHGKIAPMVSVRLKFSDRELDRLRKSVWIHSTGRPIQYQFSVTQLLGEVIVNTYRIRFDFSHPEWCEPRQEIRMQDKIVLKNNIGSDDAVILMDAWQGGNCVNDNIFRVSESKNVGNNRASEGCNSEVVVFSDDNEMRLVSTSDVWTSSLGGDTLTIDLEPPLELPVSVWLTDPSHYDRALIDFENTNAIYNDNNIGIQFHATYIYSDDIEVPECSASVESDSYVTNQHNVYYVNENLIGSDNNLVGANCGQNRNLIFIANSANLGTLPHEFGHSLGFPKNSRHSNNRPGFDNKNIMWSGGGSGRDHFSIGQAFRINTTDCYSENRCSVLFQNGFRDEPIRNCDVDDVSELCPPLELDTLPH